MSILTKYFGTKAESNDVAAEFAERVETTSEFLEKFGEKLPDLIEKVQDASETLPALSHAIEAAAPWVSAASDALGDALPPVKAVLSVVKFLTREPNPKALGLLAVSVAYQSALADAAKEVARNESLRSSLATGSPRTVDRVELKRLCREAFGREEKPEDFEGFRIETALTHPVVVRAEETLARILSYAGYPENVRIVLFAGVHVRLAEKFRATVSDGKVKDKFEPLFKLLQLGGKDVTTYGFLSRHLEYQLWRFRNAPALGKGGGTLVLTTPLKKLFVPLDCGQLSWSEIRAGFSEGRGRSPFDEKFGGRKPLLDAVTELIQDPAFRDAIVLQGTAGSGKSAFTLQLCQELHGMGLRPIRVRMRDLSHDSGISLMDDITHALALNCGDEEFDKSAGPPSSMSDVDLSNVFDATVQVGNVTMSPYVLIFDGWDEISISASEGFRVRVEKTLHAIRNQFLKGRSHRVRVILTGRPSEDVNEAKFLLNETPVLTVRPFTVPQFDGLVERLLAETKVPIPRVTRQRIEELSKQFAKDEPEQATRGRNILGLPLLALLTLWLMINDQDAPDSLSANRSALYNRLVDLTTGHGGNIEPLEPGAPRLKGPELRELLQRTAAAMTMRGTEHISYEELGLRLEAGDFNDPATAVGHALAQNKIDRLMLSFFFNTGDQGCEFTHKSFREYLFAESIIEAIKRNAHVEGAHRERPNYWQDFDSDDPCEPLVAELGLLFAPQWLQQEVWRHLAWLIEWEIGRSVDGISPRSDSEAEVLPVEKWELMRDRLVRLWDWWGEGVLMRPQPWKEKGKKPVNYEVPYLLQLFKKIAPTETQSAKLPEPVRLATFDSHLGDALLRINCKLHFEINKATGWLDRSESLTGPTIAAALWNGAEPGSSQSRRYQTRITQGDRSWWAFAPSSPDSINQYFQNYAHRIDAAGWHPNGRCTAEIDLSGADLKNSVLDVLFFVRASFRYTRLDSANVQCALLIGCDFTGAWAPRSNWYSANIASPYGLAGLDVTDAKLRNCIISGHVTENERKTLSRFKQAIVLSLDETEISRVQ